MALPVILFIHERYAWRFYKVRNKCIKVKAKLHLFRLFSKQMLPVLWSDLYFWDVLQQEEGGKNPLPSGRLQEL